MTATASHRVVIVGAGFGGLEATFGLKGAPVSITLVDRRNHHLFQPLLYQVATAALATSEIAWPIRYLLRGRPEVTTLLATVTGVDAAHGGEQGGHLGPAAQQIADRPGDFGSCQGGGRDLVQQRLEQMMVAPVDQRDLDRGAAEPMRRFQPAEAGADDHHVMGFCWPGLLCRHMEAAFDFKILRTSD